MTKCGIIILSFHNSREVKLADPKMGWGWRWMGFGNCDPAPYNFREGDIVGNLVSSIRLLVCMDGCINTTDVTVSLRLRKES
jgi:hypothetical protein